MTTNIAFGGADRRRAVITLSRIRAGGGDHLAEARSGGGRSHAMTTAAEILRGRAEQDSRRVLLRGPGVDVSPAGRGGEPPSGAVRATLRDPARPPHIGVLLDNVPDYLFWLAAAALSGVVVVGINSTYRGDQLGLLVRHTDCQLLVT